MWATIVSVRRIIRLLLIHRTEKGMNFGKRTREALERKRLASLAVEYRHLKDIVSDPHQRVMSGDQC